jgi:hypothetical protein
LDFSTFSNLTGREKGFGQNWSLPDGPVLGGEYTQDFTKYRRECSIYEEMRDFHSFRHTFVTWIRTGAHVDPLTVAAIVGHAPPDLQLRQAMQTDDYTHYSVAAWSEAIGKLDYAAYGLDLGILERTAAVCGPRESRRVEDLRNAVNAAADWHEMGRGWIGGARTWRRCMAARTTPRRMTLLRAHRRRPRWWACRALSHPARRSRTGQPKGLVCGQPVDDVGHPSRERPAAGK